MAQAPTQLTSSTFSDRSGAVPPAATPVSRSSCSSSRGAPRTWQAVPMHTVQVCSPRGSVWKPW